MQPWISPRFEEVCMNAEIGAYQGDFDPARPDENPLGGAAAVSAGERDPQAKDPELAA